MKRLGIIVDLLDQFEKHGIRYCHWKSNDHVGEGMCGLTDLDILVDRRQYLGVRESLASVGFKQGWERFGTKLPAVEGYLGFDYDTGKAAYIHLHYRLVIGKNRVKEYHLPWENVILDNRIYHEKWGLYTIDPHIELLLLIMRSACKIRWRDILRDRLGRTYFSGNWEVQRQYLVQRINADACSGRVKQLMGTEAADFFQRMIDHPVSIKDLMRFKRFCQEQGVASAAYGPCMTDLVMWSRELYRAIEFVNRRYLGMRLPVARKTLSSGGVLIVLIGPDGSGKSTMTSKLVEWLAWKLDVVHVYLGAGDGSSSRLRWIMKRAQAAVEKRGLLVPQSKNRQLDVDGTGAPRNTRKRGGVYWSAKACWALVLAAEKRAKLKSAWRARNQGMVVVADRYPQTQIEGFNDGPLLGPWLSSRNPFLRRLALWERQPYAFANRYPPDLVIRLKVAPEVALSRDPGMDGDYLRRRIAAVDSFVYPPPTRVVEIDANGSIDTVFREICRVVWSEI